MFIRSKIAAIALAGSVAISFGALQASAQTFTSGDTPLPIPDEGTTTSNIDVVTDGVTSISDVDVSVDFTHTWFGDLDANVMSPDGTTVGLFNRVPTSADPDGVYVFDDAAGAPVGTADLSGGTFQPTGSLANFNGLNPDGTWTLTINDNASGDSGTLREWQLILTLATIDQAFVAPAMQAIISGDTRQLIGTLWDRRTAAFGGGREPVADMSNPYEGGTWGTWIRLGGNKADADGAVTGSVVPLAASYDSDFAFFQGGLAGKFWDNGSGRMIGSVFGHYSNGDATLTDGTGAAAGTVGTESGGLGVGLTWLLTNGFYADFVGLFSWHDIDTATAAGATGSTDGDTVAGSVELGYNMRMNDNVSIIPQAQLVYQNTSIDSFTDSAGATHAFSDADQLEGRFGIHAEHRSSMFMADGTMIARLGVDVLHDFSNDSGAIINDTVLGFDAEGTELKVGGGFSVLPGAGNVKFGLQGDYTIALDDEGREGFSLEATAGIDF